MRILPLLIFLAVDVACNPDSTHVPGTVSIYNGGGPPPPNDPPGQIVQKFNDQLKIAITCPGKNCVTDLPNALVALDHHFNDFQRETLRFRQITLDTTATQPLFDGQNAALNLPSTVADSDLLAFFQLLTAVGSVENAIGAKLSFPADPFLEAQIASTLIVLSTQENVVQFPTPRIIKWIVFPTSTTNTFSCTSYTWSIDRKSF